MGVAPDKLSDCSSHLLYKWAMAYIPRSQTGKHGSRKLCEEVQGLHLAPGETRTARAIGMRLLGEVSMVAIARKGI